MSTNNENSAPFPSGQDSQNCPQCQAQMLREMRFCRACGYRLGEGVEDYTATRRFDAPPVDANATLPLPSAANTAPQNWGQPAATWQPRQPRQKMHWMVWVIVGVVASSALGGGALLGGRGATRLALNKKAEMPRSYMGADNLDNAENNAGVFIGVVTPPNSAADKAGLIGGDIVTAFDGQAVNNRDQLIKALTKTPVGKTVDVNFLRDGQPKTTKLTTVSEDDNDNLEKAFDKQEHGFLGVDDLDRVQIPGANVYGVRVGDVNENRPAYMAGLKEGDIITEFNGAPIRTEAELGKRIDRAAPLSVAHIVAWRGPKEGPLEKIAFDFKVGKD